MSVNPLNSSHVPTPHQSSWLLWSVSSILVHDNRHLCTYCPGPLCYPVCILATQEHLHFSCVSFLFSLSLNLLSDQFTEFAEQSIQLVVQGCWITLFKGSASCSFLNHQQAPTKGCPWPGDQGTLKTAFVLGLFLHNEILIVPTYFYFLFSTVSL